jgi:hypothetical protein
VPFKLILNRWMLCYDNRNPRLLAGVRGCDWIRPSPNVRKRHNLLTQPGSQPCKTLQIPASGNFPSTWAHIWPFYPSNHSPFITLPTHAIHSTRPSSISASILSHLPSFHHNRLGGNQSKNDEIHGCSWIVCVPEPMNGWMDGW